MQSRWNIFIFFDKIFERVILLMLISFRRILYLTTSRGRLLADRLDIVLLLIEPTMTRLYDADNETRRLHQRSQLRHEEFY